MMLPLQRAWPGFERPCTLSLPVPFLALAADASPLHASDVERDPPDEIRTCRPVRTILWIDDEVHADDALVRLLTLDGFRVDCAQSGKAGLALASTRDYHAIVLDLRLPDVPGLRVLKEFIGNGVAAPVLVVTGYYLESEVESEAMRAGAAAFRRKPLIDTGELTQVLRSLVGGASGSDGTTTHDIPKGATPEEVDNDEQELERLLTDLRQKLRRRFPTVPKDLINDAVEDSILHYLRHPGQFDARRNTSLTSFLFPSAVRNVQNLLQAEARRTSRESTFSSWWLSRPREDPSIRVQQACAKAEVRRRILAIVTDRAEREAVFTWLKGDRSTSSLADVLGLSNLTASEQRREVKRFKDRVLKRVLRASCSDTRRTT